MSTQYVSPDIIYLEHWQEPSKEHRGNYLVGLAFDCYQHQDKDRQSHYLSRELLWTGHPKSAIKEFERHIAMGGWPAERAQSMIFLGDCYGTLGLPDKQIEWYSKAFNTDPNRREALIKLARFYRQNNKPFAVLAYAKAALEIPGTDYYANDKAMYEQEPHEHLYWAYGWTGNVPEAQKHILKCLEYQPLNPTYLRDTKYYFEYPANEVSGWMSFPEQLWLYNTAKRYLNIAELGSWKGKSTHALATGTKSIVTAIDTWQGSTDLADGTYAIAKQENVLAQFKENTKQFNNIIINQKESLEAVKDYPDKSFDMVFIDATHTYKEVLADINAWLPKTKMVLCGHDYLPHIWGQVVKAVDEKFGKPDEIHNSIWVKYLVPKVTFIVPVLGRPEGTKRCLDSIEALSYPKELIEVIVIDGEGTVPQKVARGLWQSKGEYIVYASNDVEFTPYSLYNAIALSKKGYSLVAFNTGKVLPDNGNINEHFIIKKSFIDQIGGEIFDTEFYHLGVDNLLWAKAAKLNEATRSEDAIVHHYHFSKGGKTDEVYVKGWSHVKEDRALLAKKLKEL